MRAPCLIYLPSISFTSLIAPATITTDTAIPITENKINFILL